MRFLLFSLLMLEAFAVQAHRILQPREPIITLQSVLRVMSQPYSSVTSVSVTSGKYIAVKDNAGTVPFAYKCPNSVNSATVLLSLPQFTKTSHTLVYGVTSVSDASDTLFGGVYSVGGTLTGGSSKTFTPQTR